MDHNRLFRRPSAGAATVRSSHPEDAPSAAGRADDERRGDLVWLAVPPAAALVVAAVLWLAPPLARLVYPAPSWRSYPSARQLGFIRPERVEQTRFLVAAMAPFVLLALWLSLRRFFRTRGHSPSVPPWYVATVQGAIAVLVAACWVSQRRAYEWFATSTLLVAAALAGVLLVLARRGWIGRPREADRRPWLPIMCLGLAALLTTCWLLPAVYRTPNAVNVARFGELRQVEFLQDELASVLTGRTPMVNFASQYSKLLPFVVAPVLAVLGPSIGVTTGLLAILGMVGLLAVYGMLTALTEDPVAALFLYAPFLALSLFTLLTAGDERINLATLFGVVPIRIFGPFLLGWLCTRHLRNGGARAPVLLFLGAGLVAVNNTEFGAASFVALGLALWCGHDGTEPGRARARRLLAQAVVGGAGSVAAVSVLTLVRARSLPDLGYITNLTRVFAVEGFGMEPIRPALGLHIVIYLTFVIASVLGVVGAVTAAEFSPRSRVMRGLLAYTGLLGLGAGAYWVGRSVPSALFGMFPTWGLALAVLCWAALREVATGRDVTPAYAARWALPAVGACVGFGLMMTVVVQFPSPAAQVRRFTARGSDVPQYAARVHFVGANTVRGERVVILAPAGHLLARDAGVVNVSPYADELSIAFYEQMDLLLGTMRRTGVRTVFVAPTWPETSAYLAEKGYAPAETDTASGLVRMTLRSK